MTGPEKQPTARQHRPEHWLFQGNDAQSDVVDWVKGGNPIERWSMGNRYFDHVRPGDGAAFWLSGGAGGVCAIGSISDWPYLDEPWKDDDPRDEEWYCALSFDRMFFDTPISRDELRADPRFSDHVIFRFAQSTLYPLTEPEWQAITDRVAGYGLGGSARGRRVVQRPRPRGAGPKPAFGQPYRRAKLAKRAPGKPFEVDPDEVDRWTAGHSNTQNALSDLVTANGLKALSPGPGDPHYDIAWKDRKRFTVCEVKSITPANAEKQMRLGLGQVLSYWYDLSEHHDDVRAVLAVESQPPNSERWTELCESVEVVLVWPDVFASRLQVAKRRRRDVRRSASKSGEPKKTRR